LCVDIDAASHVVAHVNVVDASRFSLHTDANMFEPSCQLIVLTLRVPTPPGKSWKVLDFFLQNSRTWKVLENQFGPGKSWKNILESHAFF